MLFQEFTYKDYARVRYKEGKEEGRKEGRAKGRTEGMISVAKNALARGMPIADIAGITDLTYKEIENLRYLN